MTYEYMLASGTPASNRDVINWTRGSKTPASMDKDGEDARRLSLATLAGAKWISPGDWIVKTGDDTFDVCPPDEAPCCRPEHQRDMEVARAFGWTLIRVDVNSDKIGLPPGDTWDRTVIPGYSTNDLYAVYALECFCDGATYDYSISRDSTGDAPRYTVEIWNPVLSRTGVSLADAVCNAILAVAEREFTP